MDVELKEKIDRLMNEVSNLNDLNQKVELFHYILRQADYCIWSKNNASLKTLEMSSS